MIGSIVASRKSSNDYDATDNADNPASWRTFDSGSEAGRLLARLYGLPKNKTKIRYPKLKCRTVEALTHSKEWRNINAGNCDPRESTFNKSKAYHLKVPRVGRTEKSLNNEGLSVESLPKKKALQRCQEDIDRHNMYLASYRPPPTKAISTEEEKDRLSELLTFGAEKTLVPLTPCSEKEDSARRYDLPLDTPAGRFDEILKEIKDRKCFQSDMDDVGLGNKIKRDIEAEIVVRERELKILDPLRATLVLGEQLTN